MTSNGPVTHIEFVYMSCSNNPFGSNNNNEGDHSIMHTEINTTLAPLTVKRTKIVADVEAALAEQRSNRDRVEAIKGEDFDALAAVLTGDQKEYIVSVVRAHFGPDPEAISKENAKQAEVRAITRKTKAQQQDAPLVALLALYSNATNDEIELAPNDGILSFLRWDGDADSGSDAS